MRWCVCREQGVVGGKRQEPVRDSSGRGGSSARRDQGPETKDQESGSPSGRGLQHISLHKQTEIPVYLADSLLPGVNLPGVNQKIYRGLIKIFTRG